MSHSASTQPASSCSVFSGRRGGGEVEVVLEAAEHRVAHRAADQGQLLAGFGEAPAQLVDDRSDPGQLLTHAALDLDDGQRRQGGVGHGGQL